MSAGRESALQGRGLGQETEQANEHAASESDGVVSGFVWRLYPVVILSLFPVALTSNFWLEVLRGVRSRALDGAGHWGIAQIYSASIFPDTFGWTDAYFAGMPFPNFYPPLFHWCVGLLQSARVFSFESAFKLVLVVPILLTPAAVWLAAWRMTGRSAKAATASACACVLLLVDMNAQTTACGLDYASTFVAGFYTQPLGFVLLLAWFAAYADAHRSRARTASSGVLLALTVLGNFFNALTGALLVAATLAVDVSRLFASGLSSPSSSKDSESSPSASDDAELCAAVRRARNEARRALVAHALTPLVALALCLFWLVPVFGTYEFFVTRPLIMPLGKLLTPTLWCWYAVAACGVVILLRRPNPHARAYVIALLALAAGIVLASTVAPPWFPLQAFRFLSTLNFLLAVPVGVALASALDFFKVEIKRPRGTAALARHVSVVFLALIAFGLFQATQPTGGLAFYSREENERLEAVLRFAREHRDGRYMVEALEGPANPLHTDTAALNSYLGAQGNETLSVVYREASPNSIFFNPLVNSVSTGKDSFGISSVLADDIDFAAQPLARQLERARWLGVRYVLAETDEMKARLASQPAVAARHDFDSWSVFELRDAQTERARVLIYRPALVVSDFSVKGRRQNEYDFVRLAEEQFADGWFDVLLARSPTKKIDRLTDLGRFGALVLDTYECDDEARAFGLLRDFSKSRALILLRSDAPLFRRIESSLSEFPNAHIVERAAEERGGMVDSFTPSRHYDGGVVREAWKAVRALLEGNEVAVEANETGVDARTLKVSAEVGKNVIDLTPSASSSTGDLPVLVVTTYSPNWRAHDGENIYAATPFFMLTFVGRPTRLTYGREAADRAALWGSGLSLVALFSFAGSGRRKGCGVSNRKGV